jgi:hypothetical protein
VTEAIVAFLRARLDEAAAEAERLGGEEWAWCFSMPSGGEMHGRLSVVTTGTDPFTGEETRFSHPNDPFAMLPKDAADRYGDRMLHIARHDPAHALRDIEAKRRILDLHTPTDTPTLADTQCPTCVTWDHEAAIGDEAARPIAHPCPTLRHEAAVYEQHPDYQATWRPAS